MNKLTASLQTHALFILFGAGITFSLFLGDGKQPPADAIWACVILLLYAVYFIKNKQLPPLPRTLETAWRTLLAYYVVRSMFSDSVGYSLSATVRLFDAYLLYRLFYSIAEKKHARHIVSGVIIVSAIATVASFGCLLFPSFVSRFSPMNLLYASYGHNQLAGLLLLSIPLVITEEASLTPWYRKTLLLLLLTGMLFSLARGAWILLAGYTLFLFVTKKRIGKFNASALIIFMGAVAGLLVAMSLFTSRLAHEPQITKNNWLYKQIIKPPVYETRIQYWIQGLHAIQERPIFGSGPGTFYLQSQRFQNAPNSYSWFAHSFVVEQFVELGLIGVILWVILFVAQWRLLALVRASPVFIVTLLVFLYSLYEYNLNFLVIWLLFWSVLGWLTGSLQSSKASSSRVSLFVAGGIVLLSTFSLLIFGSSVQTARNNIDAASALTPFIAEAVKTSLNKHAETVTPIRQKRLSPMLFFHRKNPEIMARLAKYLYALGMTEESYDAYYKTLLLDPQNSVYFQEYSVKLLDNNRYNNLRDVVVVMTTSISQNKQRDIEFLTKHWERIYQCFNKDSLLWPKKILVDTYQAKSLYYAGLCLIKNKQPNEARELLRIASDSRSSWSNIYLDYASLSFWRYNDVEAAQQAILYCKSNHHSRQHCTEYDDRLLPDASVTDAEARFAP